MAIEGRKKEYLDLITDTPYKIGHWLGFGDLTEIHNAWIQSFLFETSDQTKLAHRGSYKTTCLAIAIALMIVIYPEKNIIFLRKTDTDVIEVVTVVQKILESDVIKLIVTALYGVPLVLKKDTSSEIHTNLYTGISGASQLLGLGIKTSITGKHADIVITDDIVNIKDRVSRAEREMTKTVYMELQNVKNRGGRFINTGTPWHKDDAISTMPNVEKIDCYSSGLISREQLETIRQVMTPSLFAANYELKHIASEDALFTNPAFTDKTESIYNGICHIDAAYGGTDGTAMTIVNQIEDGFVVFGRRWEKHIDDCIDEILELKKQYLAGTTYCERNADKGYLARDLEERGDVVSTYHEDTNKFIKISSHLRKHWEEIKFLEDTDPEYLSEILDYSENAEHDDCPDSLASAIRQLTGEITANLFAGGI